jgi:hypothetical protein
MIVLRKLVRDGHVAVLISPEYGAGWYSWNTDYPEILFDPAMVRLVEENKFNELETYVILKYPEITRHALRDLEVEWIREGAEFRIKEHDGSETIEFKDEVDWIKA